MLKDIENIKSRCLASSLAYISSHHRTTHEVKGKLKRYLDKVAKKNPLNEEEVASVIDYVLGYLGELDLLDDRKYARQYVQQKIKAKKPVSKMEIRNFLYKKGIPTDHIDIELEAYTSKVEREQIKSVLSTRLKGRVTREFKKKTVAYMSRRGFNTGLVLEEVGLTPNLN